MSDKINVKAVVAFAFCNLIGIAVLIILGHNPIDIFAAMAFLAFFFLIGYAIGVCGLGKYFGGKS